MWRAVETIEDAVEFLEILEATDKSSYNFSDAKSRLEVQSAGLLTVLADEKQPMRAWIFDDEKSDGRCALRISKRLENDEWLGRVVNMCVTGFDEDIFLNWQKGFPTINAKLREEIIAFGVNHYIGKISRTKNGEVFAYFVSTYAREVQNVKFDDSDPSMIIVDVRIEKEMNTNEKGLHEKVGEPFVVPDALIELGEKLGRPVEVPNELISAVAISAEVETVETDTIKTK